MYGKKNISFVVQGPYIEIQTDKLLLLLKRLFPDSEIILSTWPGINKKLDFVKYLLNVDPGEFETEFRFLKNIRRLFVSSYNGIKLSSGDIVIKLRSDSFCKDTLSDELLKIANDHDVSRIGIFMHSTPNYAFMLDDKIQIGSRSLMLEFWGQQADQITLSYLPLFEKKISKFIFPNVERYLATEQLLFLAYTKPNMNLFLSGYSVYKQYLLSLRKNFIFYNAPKFGFLSHKWVFRDSFRLRFYLLVINHLPITLSAFIMTLLAEVNFIRLRIKFK